MQTTEDQPSLLARIRELTERIFSRQKEINAKGTTHGGALYLQKLRREIAAERGKLDPIRLIATGVSCRDCRHFADVDRPMCWRDPRGAVAATTQARSNAGACGPEARYFQTAERDVA